MKVLVQRGVVFDDAQLLVLRVLTLVIHLIGTLAYPNRWVTVSDW